LVRVRVAQIQKPALWSKSDLVSNSWHEADIFGTQFDRAIDVGLLRSTERR